MLYPVIQLYTLIVLQELQILFVIGLICSKYKQLTACYSALDLVLLTQYCAGDKIEENEMGWACGAYR